MRTTLLPGLLQNLRRSRDHQATGARLYELGRTYRPDPQGGEKTRPVAFEELRLAGVLHGQREERTWTAKESQVDFFDGKGAVEAVLQVLRIAGAVFRPLDTPVLHPRAAAAVELNGDRLGQLGELHPRVCKKLGLPGGIIVFELDADLLFRRAHLIPTYQPLSRFPAVLRDLAVVVDVQLPSEEVRQLIREVGGPLVEDAALFDVYTGSQLAAGQKNLAYAIRYRAPDRTLTDAEANEAHQRIVEEVKRRVGGTLRA